VVIADYLNIEEINFLFKNKSRKYRKKTPILARYTSPQEQGTILTTYIVDSKSIRGYREETKCVLSENMIIVRKPKELRDAQGNPIRDEKNNLIYNEYAMPKEIFERNYHALNQLTTVFNKQFYKKITITAIEINDEVLSILKRYNQPHCQLKNQIPEELYIKTAWGDEYIQPGGLLTDENYSISKEEYLETYVVDPTLEEQNSTRCRGALTL
jgi:hypothetical protein